MHAMSVKTRSDFARSMLEGPNRPEARNMLIELILSIPARLSDLLVVLTSLMRPLVMALQEGQKLVGLGLRTLEYWVDRYLPLLLPPSCMVSDLVCCVALSRTPLAVRWSVFASCQGLLLPAASSTAVRCERQPRHSLFAHNSQNQRLAIRLHPRCQLTMHAFPAHAA